MGIETARAYRMDEPPTIPGVYSVLINLHGLSCPRAHEPELFAYWDGVDTWGAWEFSEYRALRARPMKSTVRYGWREIK